MSNLKNIREKMGISQQEAAGWLGISRSLVNHYEHGNRSLPTHALLQLSRLEIMITEFEKQDDSLWETNIDVKNGNGSLVTNHGISNDDGTNDGVETVPLHPRMAFEMDKTTRLQQQLALAESRHSTLQRQKFFIQYVIDNSTGHTNEKEKLWLQILHDTINYKVSKFDEARQLPLRAKIVELGLKAGKNRH